MASLWTQLLFLHGHIADPALARRLMDPPAPAGNSQGGKRQRLAPQPATQSVVAARSSLRSTSA
jgi:hypothetical protein